MSHSYSRPSVAWRRLLMLAFTTLVSLAAARVTTAQTVDVVELSDDGTTVVLRFDIDWRLPLAQAVDSVDADAWSYNEVEAVTRGVTRVSELIELVQLEMPVVSVVSRSFDEMPVPVAGDGPGYAVSDAWAEGLGWRRKRPVVGLTVQLARLDYAEGVVRRLNSITVAVERTGDPGRISAAKSSEGGTNPHLAVDRSALADGQILKMRLTEEGVYRIDRGFMQAAGLNPDAIDPANVRVFGNGGAPLPALNSAFRYADLVENPVVRTGGGDGRFDQGDAVVFYGAAPRGWRLDGTTWKHYVHPGSNYNVYFLKIDASTGLTAVVQPAPPAGSDPVRTTTRGRFVLDVEEQVWSREHGSGTDWVSNQIRGGSSRTFLENLIPPGFMGGPVDFDTRFAIASNPRATVAFESNGAVLAQRTSPRSTFEDSALPTATPTTLAFQHSFTAQNGIDLDMRLIDTDNEPQAALDYVRLFYDQALTAENGYLRFATVPGATGTQTYRLNGFQSAPTVLDVTEPDRIRRLKVLPTGSDWSIRISGDDLSTGPRELVAFTNAALKQVPSDQSASIPNQNVHGTNVFPDFVIVAPSEFMSAAERLADHRRSEGMTVQVESIEAIYNEFSGGLPDMRAVRDFLKLLYDRATSDGTMLRYALLLGDGHYDFRNLSSRQGSLENWIFPFEPDESMFTDGTYTSDDYFGLLDDSEGEWVYTSFTAVSSERMDIGVGRFPVQTAAEADMVVDKVIRYDNPETFGAWRARYTFVADDDLTGLSGQQNDRDLHLANVDQVAELLQEDLYPRINQNKIYGQNYERQFLNGFKLPGAKRDILNALESGTLVFNYSGHGGPDGLAQEEIFTLEDAAALTNGDRLPIFVTATCSFGWWDLEESQSGAEVALLNPNGGAVALMTTVRLVYTSGDTTSLNAGLNRALNIQMFRTDEDGLPRRLGDIMLDTKNTNVGLQGNSRKFNLLGDPSMRIGLAPRTASIESLSGVELETTTGQMRALDRVTIDGAIRDAQGNIAADFNGDVKLTVFDAERRVPKDYAYWSSKTFFTMREDLIWRGSVRATAGRFTAEFVVPKDISYSDEPGRISVYAADNAVHALGFTENFNVGGTSANPPNDALGPEISLFLNDTTFVSGSSVPADPELIVKLFDDSGINTVGAGVGHEMLLVVDNDQASAVDIASAFEAEQNSFRRGEVRWRLDDLDAGAHSISVRAWDVLNNSNEASLEFFISDDEVLGLANVYNYPNPMSRETRFVFDHNQPAGTPARVQIRIFTLNGRPIRTIQTDEALPDGVLPSGPVQVHWDGRDDDLDRPATGIYLYQVRVEVDRPGGGSRVSEHIEKLAYIR
ncbi:MAG: type IX secretion system sortase PorU [Rhodothermales bacterium]|nr:type IX secretion system sortase PorU [Rhodothermales bacterium]